MTNAGKIEEAIGRSGRYRHHKYTWSKPFGTTRHCWELVGKYGAIHFHATVTVGYGPNCGLEFHSLDGEGAPHHLKCPLTGGRCWHDGTSLYADEHLWPVIQEYLRAGNHEEIFRLLESEADGYFERALKQPEGQP